MWREMQNVDFNREQFSSNIFQFMAHENLMMRALYLLIHENKAVYAQKWGTTIITLKEIQLNVKLCLIIPCKLIIDITQIMSHEYITSYVIVLPEKDNVLNAER